MGQTFRSNLFEGECALITGGGTGIGYGIALALAEHGATTVLLSRDPAHVESASTTIRAATERPSFPMVADVRDVNQVKGAIERTMDATGRIDMLINGAAGNFLCPAEQLSPNGFGVVLDIDAKGTWNVSHAVFHAWMKEHGGRILNISATLHYGATAQQLHVSAAKAAVDALTRNLALEWGPLGIRTNGIAPGPIRGTEGAARLFAGPIGDRLARANPLRRLGSVADIASASLFLLSEEASFINGATLVVDGGGHLVGSLLGEGWTSAAP